jgi:nucleotide-binding universal stress UspA family protein
VVHSWHLPYVGVYPFVGDAYDERLFARAAGEVVEQSLRDVPPPAGLAVERHVVHGSPAQTLLHAAATADLLVVGARGLGAFAGMVLGSVGQHVARHAPCPVVVTRAEP